jgi:hypothetical protein
MRNSGRLFRYIWNMSNAENLVSLEWTLGERLWKARRAAGISREEMGEYLGYTSQGLGLFEGDQRVPKKAIIRLWALRFWQCGLLALQVICWVIAYAVA